jgi:hypothetical protein
MSVRVLSARISNKAFFQPRISRDNILSGIDVTFLQTQSFAEQVR